MAYNLYNGYADSKYGRRDMVDDVFGRPNDKMLKLIGGENNLLVNRRKFNRKYLILSQDIPYAKHSESKKIKIPEYIHNKKLIYQMNDLFCKNPTKPINELFRQDSLCFICYENMPQILCENGDFGICESCFTKSTEKGMDLCCFCNCKVKQTIVNTKLITERNICIYCNKNEKSTFCPECWAILYCNSCALEKNLTCPMCKCNAKNKKIFPKYDLL